MKSLRKISRRGWGVTARWTLYGAVGCTAISLCFTWIYFQGVERDVLRSALVVATVLPVTLATPLFFYLTVKLRELAIANHKLAALAATDGLTGLLNRGALVARAEALLAAQGGARSSPRALIIVDVDKFKAINDRFGHVQGDEVLVLVAKALRAATRDGDLVGRLGGEEFGVFLPDADGAEEIAERIRAAVATIRFAPTGAPHPVSVSVGVAASVRAVPFRDLFKIADARLYRAKEAGRNRVCATDPPAPVQPLRFAR